MTHALFHEAANRYDLHTPPDHYKHDHQFVLSLLPARCAVLDAGCGTGVFLSKALEAGFDAYGIDASKEMITVAAERAGENRVNQLRMQDFDEKEKYDAIVSLSWSFNYVESMEEAKSVLSHFFRGLKKGGLLILQIAHAPNAFGALNEDREAGPHGEPDDVVFLYRFAKAKEREDGLRVQYVYGCLSERTLICEEHHLEAANAHMVAAEASAIGFENVQLLDSWRGEPLKDSLNAFLLAKKA